jgi:hypothetical protein
MGEILFVIRPSSFVIRQSSIDIQQERLWVDITSGGVYRIS